MESVKSLVLVRAPRAGVPANPMPTLANATVGGSRRSRAPSSHPEWQETHFKGLDRDGLVLEEGVRPG